MKLGNLLLIASLLIGSVASAQDGELEGAERECLRMRKIANDAMEFTNYREATTYFLKAEQICDEFGKDNYDRLVSCAMQMAQQTEGNEQKAYIDTLLGAWDRAEEKGFYDEVDDLNRGYYYMYSSTPDNEKADFHMKRAIDKRGDNIEGFLPLYFYNVYSLWYIAPDDEAKDGLKQRFIREYFELTKVISEKNFAPKTQETLKQYFANMIQTCDDILPAMPQFMSTLPEETAAKKELMLDMAGMLADLGCSDGDEYKALGKALYEIAPEDPEVKKIAISVMDNYAEKMALLDDLIANATSEEEKNDYRYMKTYAYFKAGQYQTAYTSAKSVGGKYKGDALSIMGQCVAATANSCGDSTFERKCNYVYAVQMLEQARANGASVSSLISNYQSKYPTSGEIFEAGNPTSVSLSCWGVSVNPKGN